MRARPERGGLHHHSEFNIHSFFFSEYGPSLKFQVSSSGEPPVSCDAPVSCARPAVSCTAEQTAYAARCSCILTRTNRPASSAARATASRLRPASESRRMPIGTSLAGGGSVTNQHVRVVRYERCVVGGNGERSGGACGQHGAASA